MGYGVFHHEKGKSTGGAIGNHIDRTIGMEHTFKHADPSRLHLNKDYTPSTWKHMSMENAVAMRIDQGYNKKREIRTDAVKFCKAIFSGTHEDMIKLFESTKGDDWVKTCREFAEKEFGKHNIVRFTLHMDEKTPHIHCIFVPLTEDGRMSAKDVMGNKKALSARQDRYGKEIEKYGLERGLKGAGITHEDAKKYYGRMENAAMTANKIEIDPKILNIEIPDIKIKDFERNVLGYPLNLRTWKINQEQNIKTALTTMALEANKEATTKLMELVGATPLLIDENVRMRRKMLVVKETLKKAELATKNIFIERLQEAQKKVSTYQIQEIGMQAKIKILEEKNDNLITEISKVHLTGKLTSEMKKEYEPRIKHLYNNSTDPDIIAAVLIRKTKLAAQEESRKAEQAKTIETTKKPEIKQENTQIQEQQTAAAQKSRGPRM